VAGGAGVARDQPRPYPTSTDSVPSNDLIHPDPGNNANFWQEDGDTIGSPYYRTPVGEFENSESPYGTFDQGRNVWEWNEAILYGSNRGLRGGACWNTDYDLPAADRPAYQESPELRPARQFPARAATKSKTRLREVAG